MDKKTPIIMGSLAALLILGVSGYALYRHFGPPSSSSSLDSSSSQAADSSLNSQTVAAEGANIRMLTKGTDINGYGYITYSYIITPDNATDKTVVASLNWENSSSDPLSSYMACSLNMGEQTVTVTKLQDFSNIINLRIEAKSNPEAFATVAIHCDKRFLGWKSSSSTDTYAIGLKNINSAGWESGVSYIGRRLVDKYGLGYSTSYTDDVDVLAEIDTSRLTYSFCYDYTYDDGDYSQDYHEAVQASSATQSAIEAYFEEGSVSYTQLKGYFLADIRANVPQSDRKEIAQYGGCVGFDVTGKSLVKAGEHSATFTFNYMFYIDAVDLGL